MPRFTKTCFPAVSELCETLLGLIVSFQEKKCQGGSVLWMLTTIPVVTLIRVNCSVRWLPLKKLEVSFLFQKTQSHHDQAVIRESKINQGVSGKFNAATVQLSLGEVLILPSDPNFQVHRNAVFPVVLVLFEDAPRMQYVIPWEKKPGGVSVSECRLPNLSLLWLGVTELSDDFPVKAGQLQH